MLARDVVLFFCVPQTFTFGIIITSIIMGSSRRRKKKHKASSQTVKVGRLKRTKQFLEVQSVRLPNGGVDDDDGGRTDWNQEKSLVTNYERNGLVSNANGFYFAGGRNALQNTETTTSDEKDETAKTRTRRVATENALTKNSDRDELRKAVGVASSTGVARPKRLTPRQRRLCEAMTNKHGKDNVEKMFRDIKLNTMQKTKGELRQMLESYEYYKEENEATDGRIRVDFRAPTKRLSIKRAF